MAVKKIKRADKERVVLSETFPAETPIIFSNDGFYKHCLDYAINRDHLGGLFKKWVVEGSDITIPYHYKIRKNDISLRNLSLMHPSWQYKFIKFYKKYDDLICYYCSSSKISLRYPDKIASSSYVRNKSENIHQYKKGNNVSTIGTDKIAKHISTYFSYPVSREHKFFGSSEFLALENKYSHFWILDVSKCFDSIYTHSISWALKSKDFSKKHINYNTFGDEFDQLMRSGKDNETNGIVIGPEISRIFAEIIFQDIDKKIISRLKCANSDYLFDKAYSIKRYVDDIFVFAKDKKTAADIAQAISIELFQYNFHLNEQKHEKYVRPFFTPKSRIIFDVDNAIRDFYKKFTINQDIKKNNAIKKIVVPDVIRKRTGLNLSFINQVKLICSKNDKGYDAVSAYIISSLSNRIKELISYCDNLKDIDKYASRYSNSLLSLIEVAFFFYTMEPSATTSIKISTTIILTVRFFDEKLKDLAPTVKQRILELAIRFYDSQKLITHDIQKSEIVRLESLNLLASLREMGDGYLIPEDNILEIFEIEQLKKSEKPLNYFDIITGLYYIKNNNDYIKLRDKIEDSIEQIVGAEFNPIKDTKQIYIILDTLSCPFLSEKFRNNILQKLQSSLSSQKLKDFEDNPWFVDWSNIDLLVMLEKKELNIAY